MGYTIDRSNFALKPEALASVTGTYTLSASGWSSQAQSVHVDVQKFPLKYFQLCTINIPPADMSKWADSGVYVESEDYSYQIINFRCETVPTDNLTFTVIQTPLDRIGNFVGVDSILTKYDGAETAVTVPEGVYEIAENAFRDNTNIVIVYFPETGIYSIGDDAFSGCTSLSMIVFYQPIEIKAEMFEGCTAVTDVALRVDNGTWTENIDLSFTDQIVVSRLEEIITKLYNYSGGTAHTLKLGYLNKSRLSPAQLAAAAAKNWVVL